MRFALVHLRFGLDHDRTCETASITNQFEQEELEIDQTSNMTNSKKL